MELNFEADCFDSDFTPCEDFGLAKSFTSTPIDQIAPLVNFNNHNAAEVENQIEQNDANEVRVDGFCFKMAPVEDQVQFQRKLKEMAPKMTDFRKGTTTIAFEFKEGVLVAVDARAT